MTHVCTVHFADTGVETVMQCCAGRMYRRRIFEAW
jgi:hypothetical protein